MPRLVAVTVEGLLGRFDHRIEFPGEWEFVIIHGPNGVGKTKLLEIIYALSRGRLERLLPIPFTTTRVTYDDGSTISVRRSGQLPLPGAEQEGPPSPADIAVDLVRPGAESVTFDVTRSSSGLDLRQAAQLLERQGVIERVGPSEWVDLEWGDRAPVRMLVERHADRLASQFVATPDEVPEEYKAFIKDVPVHLIETQRLLVSELARRQRPSARRDGPSTTVLRYSDDLIGRLRTALAENSRTSQRLDRTFPRRVISAPAPGVTDEQIRERYGDQARLRDRLTAISLLDAVAADLPLPDRALQDWERRVLWTYLEDTEQKLATFQPLLARVQLLQEIVNARFLFKTLSIDRERGFRFKTDEGVELGPSALSSGEQHELVLAYDLLFNVAPGSLVLIDEPEISLHVSWQQKFLNDLTRISELQALRFIVATHSPQIIHKWWHRTEALYRDESETDADEDDALESP